MDEQLEQLKIDYKNGFPINIEWLIQQAEKAEELESDIKANKKSVDWLLYQNQRYKEVLEFYADENNHRKLIIDGDTMYLGRTIAEKDSGKKARQALRGEST